MLREIIREQNEEIEHLQGKLDNIELYIKEYERGGLKQLLKNLSKPK